MAFGLEDIREVPVCGMEELPLVLRGADGMRYAEVDGNIWMPIGGRADVAYVGTSRHGGHMTLRPLFVRADGIWRNATTGAECTWFTGTPPGNHQGCTIS